MKESSSAFSNKDLLELLRWTYRCRSDNAMVHRCAIVPVLKGSEHGRGEKDDNHFKSKRRQQILRVVYHGVPRHDVVDLTILINIDAMDGCDSLEHIAGILCEWPEHRSKVVQTTQAW